MRFKDPKNTITTKYGKGNLHHQRRIKQTMLKALTHHSRVSLFRLDLHYPDTDIHYVMDYEAISRFFKYLNEQLPAFQKRKLKQLKLTKPDGYIHNTKIGHNWVREYGKETYFIGKKLHYHVMLLLNADAFNSIRYNKGDTENLYTVIAKCWLKAIEVYDLKYSKLVHIPKNPVYEFNRNDLAEKGIDGIYDSMKGRLDYLIKHKGKDVFNGKRSFGCSQG
ncbi:inovirus Gp2 family protein [Enterobacter sp. JMULE2]|uniref:YagK/YfjJ domain-containing protein n=1 Tax=Enterobacter sp. JMULE2 TaxID=2518340 RepID=UPI0015776ECF|nr:inovirus-type Gp2 protein [Enterobacter sp. JMULE2]NTZ39826.1 inovirus Gp2 family protein [Enterobacter sp. JMULE2]